jgi:hypothetical protein
MNCRSIVMLMHRLITQGLDELLGEEGLHPRRQMSYDEAIHLSTWLCSWSQVSL